MVDITHKSNTLRIATAQAIVKVGSEETIQRIQNNTVPKGDVFAMSKAAGLLGIKKTPEILPDCHPLPIEYTGIEYRIQGLEIQILMTVKTIYKTGVEVEAMHGASIVALNMYDMLKPIDKQIEISSIKLLHKSGGKSDFKAISEQLTAKVVVCSDSISAGEKEDNSGKLLLESFQSMGIQTELTIISDDPTEIENALLTSSHDIILFSGGTGVGPRDNTPDVLLPHFTSRLQGIEEELRRYGQERMHYAMLSRSVVGLKENQLILAIPGSTGAAKDCMSAIFPYALHIFHIMKGGGH